MTQLCFLFVVVDDPPPAVSRTTLYWRKRINRAARTAFEIGRRQRKPVPKAPRPLRAAVVPAAWHRGLSRDAWRRGGGSSPPLVSRSRP
jgi:hypothetical protein